MTRRALLLAAVVVAAAAIVFVLATRPAPPESTTPSTQASQPQIRVSAGTTSPSASSSAEPTPEPAEPPETEPWTKTEESRQIWAPVVIGFGTHYTLASKPRDSATWRAALAPFGTDKVVAFLRTQNLDDVPVSAPYDGSYEVLEYGDDDVVVQITYNDGYALVLYVATDPQTKTAAVTAFDRLEQ